MGKQRRGIGLGLSFSPKLVPGTPSSSHHKRCSSRDAGRPHVVPPAPTSLLPLRWRTGVVGVGGISKRGNSANGCTTASEVLAGCCCVLTEHLRR